MDIEKIRDYCLSKPKVEESFPFGEDTLVFKVGSKIFVLLNLVFPHSINLKCDPEKAIELRESYDEIQPGYHMNKKHWNTVDLTGTLSNDLIISIIDHSYDMVVKGLTKKERELLEL